MTIHEKAKKMELEILLTQYDYTKKELKAKEDYSNVINSIFEESINEFLETDESLKNKWKENNQVKNESIEDMVKSPAVSNKAVEEKSKLAEHSHLEKELFRNIAKETHPDKFKDTDASRTDIYIQASEAYETRDLAGLLLAGTKCGVHFDITEDILSFMDTLYEKVEKRQSRTNFLSSTIPWKWYHAPKSVQVAIISAYVDSRLN